MPYLKWTEYTCRSPPEMYTFMFVYFEYRFQGNVKDSVTEYFFKIGELPLLNSAMLDVREAHLVRVRFKAKNEVKRKSTR